MYLNIMIYIAFFVLLIFESKAQTISIISPKNSEELTPGKNVSIQWINSSSDYIDLYYSFDNINWNLIETKISGDSYNWTMPFTLKKNIFFKIEIEKYTKPTLLWDEENAHSKEIKCIRFIGDNKILTAGADNYAKIWDLTTRKEVNSVLFQTKGNIQSAVETTPGIIAVNLDTKVYLWNYKFNEITEIISDTSFGYVRFIDYNPAASLLALACEDGVVRVFDLNGKKINEFWTGFDNYLYTVKFNRDGNLIAAGGYNGFIYIFNRINNTIVKTIERHGDAGNMVVWSVDISPDNNYFLSCGVDRTVRMWEMKTLSEVKRFYHKFHARTVEFSQKGNIFLSSSLDSTLNQFSTSLTSKLPEISVNHNGQIISSDYSFTADSFATAGRDLSFKIWKNFDYSLNSDAVSCKLLNTIEIYAPNIISKTGEIIQIPIKIKNNENLPPDFFNEKKITLSLPKDLLRLNSVEFSNSIHNDDTIIVNIGEVTNNTLLVLSGEVLKGSRKHALFDLINVNMPDSINVQMVLNDGSLDLIDSCQSDEDRLIEISDSKPYTGIYPNPVKDLLNVNMSLIEDSRYKFEVIDNNGTVISELLNSELKSGYQEFIFNLKIIPNGLYFLKISWFNKSKSIKFIKRN
jgi:WD40 repeat protein